MGKSTINGIIDEVCDAIWESLADFVKTPTNPQDWENIFNDFDEIWNMPHCLEAIDGKHITMTQPKTLWFFVAQLQGIFQFSVVSNL